MAFKWMTQKRAKQVFKKMLNEKPKYYTPYRFLIGNAIVLKKYEYEGIKIEYITGLEKDKILLVDENTYNLMINQMHQ